MYHDRSNRQYKFLGPSSTRCPTPSTPQQYGVVSRVSLKLCGSLTFDADHNETWYRDVIVFCRMALHAGD